MSISGMHCSGRPACRRSRWRCSTPRSTRSRSPVTPDVPSLADEGVTDIDVDIWYALLGPPGLPKEQVALLNAEVNAILRDGEIRDNLGKQGLNPLPGSPEDLARMIATDLERWTRLIRDRKSTRLNSS